MAQMAHLSTIVYGYVQGVYFRYFVQRIARTLNITGYVRNLPSGEAVEVQAEGNKQQLVKLVEQLKVGPPGARVKEIKTTWSDYRGEFSDFRIKYR